MTVRPAARNDIDETAEYIAQDNLIAGLAFLDATTATFHKLVEMPLIGRARNEFAHDRLAGIRSLPIRGFENWLVFIVRLETEST